MRRWKRTGWFRTVLLPVLAVLALTALFLPGAAPAAEHPEETQNAENRGNASGDPRETEYEDPARLSGNAASGFEPLEIRAERLPERWYAGDHGKKPTVRYQGGDGTCWALAAVSALEAALMPEQHIVFSADHMSRKNAFTVGLDEGGDYMMAIAYLSGWQGPVTEEEDPYGDGFSPDGLTPAVHVQEIRLLEDAKPGTVKTAVQKYGAVQTSLYMKRDYNAGTKAYYCPEEQTPNHDVVILGWDDTYSRFLFSETPDRDGAFICQNTWKDGFGEDGIFYVSYADPNIAKNCVCYTRIEPTDNYSRICQYDDCGWQGRQGYADESCWFANVYTAIGGERADTDADRSGEASARAQTEQSASSGEALAAVGFYAVGPDTSYEIYLARDFHGEEDFRKREYLQKGRLQDAGYYTVDLETPQPLAAGERFAVIVKITTPGEENPVAVEYRADEYTQNVTTQGKESYLSQYGELWENTQERFETNVCLKAYMREIR